MSITINPNVTSAPQNNFELDTEGYVQGAFTDDPSSRLYLASGVIDSTVTSPVWPAYAVIENVNASGSNALGNTLTLATSETDVTAFTTGNQGYNGIITPGSNAPQWSAGMTVPYFRMGSGSVRLQVQCDATLAASLSSGATNQQVQWDFNNQKLIAFVSGTALACKVLNVNTSSKIVSYNSSTGATTWTIGAVATILI